MKRRCASRVIAATAMCVGGQLALAGHQIATWEMDAVGSWSDATKWSTNPVFPSNGGGNTFDAVIDSTFSTLVTLDTNISINSLTLNLGRFTGNHALNLSSDFLFYGGEIVGVGSINVASYMEIGGLDHQFALSTINIAPAANVFWWGGLIDASDENGGGGIVNNDGLFVDQTDDSWTWGNALTPVFNNGGSYLKQIGTVGSGKKLFAAFNNTGNVDVEAGDLWLSGGGTSNGLYTVAPGTRLLISDYNQIFSAAEAPISTFEVGSSIVSDGTVVFGNDFGNATTEIYGQYDSAMTVVDAHDPAQTENTDGRVTFHEGAVVNTVTVGDLRMQSGTARFETGQTGGVAFNGVSFVGGVIDTSDDLFFNTLDWSGGTLKGVSTNTSVSSGTTSFSGTDPKSLVNVTLYLGTGGTTTMSTGSVTLQDAEIRNLGNALFDFQGVATLENADPSQYSATFRNVPGAVLRKSSGSGSASLNMVYLINERDVNGYGTVEVTSGKLFLNGGGFNQGLYHIGSGATLEIGGGTNFQSHYFTSTSVVTGDANSELHVSSAQFYIQAGSITHLDRFKSDSTFISYEGGEFTANSITLDNGSNMILAPGHDKTLKTKSISVVQFSESQLNLNDNQMIVDYDTGEIGVADHIQQLVGSGYHGGGWDGEGIVSSMANSTNFTIGYADNSQLGFASFGGYTVDATSVLLKYTYYGDTNLDGKVDILDIATFVQHFNQSGLWFDGDFNYNGFVDSHDLSLLAYNWQAGHLSPPLGEILSQLQLPEPNLTCLLFGGLIGLRRRRGAHRCDNSA